MLLPSDDASGDADADLLAELGRAAGSRGRLAWRPLAGVGELNRHYVVEVGTAAPMIARLYGWPFPVPEPFDRMAKEAWVLGALAGTSPVIPELLATATTATGRGLLMTRLPGDVFGEVAGTLPAPVAAGTWQSVADALRAVHGAVVPGMTAAGGITGDGVRAYPGGWGAEQARQFQAQAERLAAARPELAAGLDRAIVIVTAAAPILDERPVSLVHGDAHPWNVLVAPSDANGTSWRCTGLLDWEFACAGDGLVDIVRLDIGRIRPLGPPPVDLLVGYQDHSARIAEEIYRLTYHVWMANDSRYFAHRPAFDNAENYLRELAVRLDHLDRVIGR